MRCFEALCGKGRFRQTVGCSSLSNDIELAVVNVKKKLELGMSEFVLINMEKVLVALSGK